MNKKNNKKELVSVKQRKVKEAILEHLRRIPVVQAACERTNVSRATFYRLRAEDENFKTSIDAAIAEGVAFINDMSEGQLISLIKDKNFSALQLWLRTHHPSYTSRVEVSGKINVNEELTPEQESMVKKALELGSFHNDDKK